MNKQHEKAMLDLQRLLKTQDFKTMEEAQEFVNKNVVGQKIPRFDKEALTPEEHAQDLVYQAIEEDDVIKSDTLIFMALLHDPDCSEAYEYLGDMAGSPMASLMFYKNGFVAARKKLGEKFFKENKGHFWGIHETRPFMRCLKNYAECLYTLNQKMPALEAFFELLELNPNDNQGIRDQTGLYLLELDQFEKYLKLHQKYHEDGNAFHLYNYALYLFLTYGDGEKSNEALGKAKAQNKHIFHLLPSKKHLPPLPEFYSTGDKNEAIYYCTMARAVWESKKGAMTWLQKNFIK